MKLVVNGKTFLFESVPPNKEYHYEMHHTVYEQWVCKLEVAGLPVTLSVSQHNRCKYNKVTEEYDLVKGFAYFARISEPEQYDNIYGACFRKNTPEDAVAEAIRDCKKNMSERVKQAKKTRDHVIKGIEQGYKEVLTRQKELTKTFG